MIFFFNCTLKLSIHTYLFTLSQHNARPISIKIQTSKDGGKIRIGGVGGAINIDVPDFIDLDVASDFDIDGVKLYPGSQVTKVDVDADDKNGADNATVRSEERRGGKGGGST